MFQRSGMGRVPHPHEFKKYFDMSVVLIPVGVALRAVGNTITSMETVGALMAAGSELQA